MPAGVTWGRYLRFACAAYITMMAGSQTVHYYYRPLDDLQDLVKVHKERLLQEHLMVINAKEELHKSMQDQNS